MAKKPIAVLLGVLGLWMLPVHGQSSFTTKRDVATALSSHQYAQALRLLAPVLQASPRDASLWTLRGVALDGQGHTQESLASFHQALALDGSFTPALEGAAQTAYLHHDPKALQICRKTCWYVSLRTKSQMRWPGLAPISRTNAADRSRTSSGARIRSIAIAGLSTNFPTAC
jgi:tetratricopeptide (TPR) repeat protein